MQAYIQVHTHETSLSVTMIVSIDRIHEYSCNEAEPRRLSYSSLSHSREAHTKNKTPFSKTERDVSVDVFSKILEVQFLQTTTPVESYLDYKAQKLDG